MRDKKDQKTKVYDLQAHVERARKAAERNAPDPDQLLEDLEREAQAGRSRCLARAETSLTTEDVRRLVLDQHDDTEPLRASYGFVGGNSDLLVLHGGIGTGKTFAACWALLRLGGGHFVAAMDLPEIFSSFAKAGRREELFGAHVLVVDDVGQELSPERTGPWLSELVNRRRNFGRRTIWTTNLPPEELKERYQEPRLWDRVQQCVQPGSGFTGPSLRRRK